MHRKADREAKELSGKTLRLQNLTTLMNYTNDLMCIIDQGTLKIDHLNSVFKLYLGYELSEVRGWRFVQLLKKNPSTDKLMDNLKSLKDDQVSEFSCTVLMKNGKGIIFDWIAIAKNGKIHASAKTPLLIK